MATKVALVTGGAQGLGKAFAEVLLKKNYNVALLDINKAVGTTTSQVFNDKYGPNKTIFLECDVTNSDGLAAAFRSVKEKYGRVDVVVNNAGIINEKKWQAMLAVNLSAVMQGTYLATEYMRKDAGGDGGIVINVASVAGLGPMLGFPGYNATKHGVVGFSKGMAETFKHMPKEFGISVLCLCPAFTNTDMINSHHMVNGILEMLPKKHHRMLPAMMSQMGIMEIADVAAGFKALIEDNINGAIMSIYPGKRKYVGLHAKQSKL